MSFKNFLTKLQDLPEQRKKIVLWTIVVVLSGVMGFFWVRGVMNNLSRVPELTKSVKIPTIDTSDIPKMPSLDILKTTTPSNK